MLRSYCCSLMFKYIQCVSQHCFPIIYRLHPDVSPVRPLSYASRFPRTCVIPSSAMVSTATVVPQLRDMYACCLKSCSAVQATSPRYQRRSRGGSAYSWSLHGRRGREVGMSDMIYWSPRAIYRESYCHSITLQFVGVLFGGGGLSAWCFLRLHIASEGFLRLS